MPDSDKDLVHLFVRDLDDIELPPRQRWRPAQRKESQLMKTGRYVLYASAVATVLVLALIASFGLRDSNRVAATPSPTSPTAASAGVPSPTGFAATVSYASAGLGYSIETPPPWHRSSCSPAVATQKDAESVSEIFVPLSARDEAGSDDNGFAYPTLRVFVEANPQSLTPRQWAEQGRTVGAATSELIEDVVYADRPAARKVLTLGGTPLDTYFVANSGRMYVVSPFARVPPDGATQQTMARMIDSFRFLTDSELASERAALPIPLPPRTPEQLVDDVAAAMTAKDVDALTGLLSACVTTVGERVGGTFVSREKYVDDLRAAFAAGLVVTVQRGSLVGDRASGNLTAASTWRDSLFTRARKLMLRRGENDRWELQGTTDRL
jgi:hypothetical protein